jgi:hypothetical protein
MAFESGQGLNQRPEGPFGIFRVAAAGPECVHECPLALDNAAGFGDTVLSRRERIVRAFYPRHM